MTQPVNWKLVNSLSIPAGLILGWIFKLGWNKFLKWIVLIVFLAIIGAIVYKLSEENKRINMYNAIALTIAITLIMNLLRQI